MKTLLFLLLLGIWPVSAAELVWQNDYPGALAQSAKEGKPLLIDFTASWCTWCRFLEQTTFRDEVVQRSLASYILVKIDYDRAKDLVAKFRVEGVPALFVLNQFGETVGTQSGYADPRAFYDWLTRNDKAARSTVSASQEEAERLESLIATLGTSQTDQLTSLVEIALKNNDSSKAATTALQTSIEQNPAAFLDRLNDRSLAVRILFTELYGGKMGPKFHFDPWDSPEARAVSLKALALPD